MDIDFTCVHVLLAKHVRACLVSVKYLIIIIVIWLASLLRCLSSVDCVVPNRHHTGDIFEWIILNENCCIVVGISLTFGKGLISISNYTHTSVGWNYLSIPKFQRCSSSSHTSLWLLIHAIAFKADNYSNLTPINDPEPHGHHVKKQGAVS